MSLKEDIKSWIETDTGLVSNIINPGVQSCDNIILFSTTYIALQRKLNTPDYEFENHFAYVLKECEIVPGLYYRHPPPQVRSLEQFDDYLGMVNFSYRSFCYTDVAQDIYNYGKNNLWCYNSESPGHFQLNCDFSRMFYVTSTIKAANKLEWNLWDKIKWFGVITATNLFSSTGDTNGRCLMYLAMEIIENTQSGWFVKLTNKWFKKNLTKRYTDLSGLYNIYFGENHPLTVYSKGVNF